MVRKRGEEARLRLDRTYFSCGLWHDDFEWFATAAFSISASFLSRARRDQKTERAPGRVTEHKSSAVEIGWYNAVGESETITLVCCHARVLLGRYPLGTQKTS